MSIRSISRTCRRPAVLLIPALATMLSAADFSTDFDGSGTGGSISTGSYGSSGGGGYSGSSSSSSGGSSINPSAWSSPDRAWSGRALPPRPAPTVIEDSTAHDRSLEARSQAKLADDWYQTGFTAAQEKRYADAAAAFAKARTHRSNARDLSGSAKLGALVTNDEAAIAWSGTMHAAANLGADLYANAATVRKDLEKLVADGSALPDTRQTLLRAVGGEAEAKGRAALRDNHWTEARDFFAQASTQFNQAAVNATRFEKESKDKSRFPYDAKTASSDLLRAHQSQATALNGVAIELERAGNVSEAYKAAKEAAALWPDMPALQENVKRLGGIPVGFEKPQQGTPVDTRP